MRKASCLRCGGRNWQATLTGCQGASKPGTSLSCCRALLQSMKGGGWHRDACWACCPAVYCLHLPCTMLALLLLLFGTLCSCKLLLPLAPLSPFFCSPF